MDHLPVHIAVDFSLRCNDRSRAEPETTYFLSRSLLPRCPNPSCIFFRYHSLYLSLRRFALRIGVANRCFPHNLRVSLPEVRPTVALEGEDLVNPISSSYRIQRLLATPLHLLPETIPLSAPRYLRTRFRARSTCLFNVRRSTATAAN